MRLGIDVSNYQKQFSLADAQTIKANGCSFVILGRQAQNRPYEATEAAAALDAGLTLVGEYWISLGGAWPSPLPETKFIAVDVEPGSEFTTEQDIDNALAQVATTGRIPVIYSSKWAWDQLGLTTTKYAGIALWNANYDGRSDGFTLPRPFGGWSECAIDQYTDKGQFGLAYQVDANAIDDAFWDRCYPPTADVRPVDVGLNRLDLEAMLRALVSSHARNGGEKSILHDIVDGKR